MHPIRAMISSTQRDLKRFRDCVEQVICSFGIETIRSETYVAPGKSPLEVCREMAESCDIYIGIFGARYGSVDPVLNISITEFEYQIARMNNPNKVLIYIRKVQKYDPRQKVFIQRLESFRDGYFRHAYFNTGMELSSQVRNDLIAWISERVHRISEIEQEARRLKLKVEYMQQYYNQLAQERIIPREILL